MVKGFLCYLSRSISYHTSSLRVKITFLSLLWTEFEMQKTIKAITKESEPGVRNNLMHPPKFAFPDNSEHQSRV